WAVLQSNFSDTAAAAPYRYRLHGVCAGSEVELPGIVQDEPLAACSPDALIRWGSVAQELPGARASASYFQAAGQMLLLHLAGTARYAVSAGREIVVDPYPDAEGSRVRLFLLGSALGALLYQRGL